MDWKSKEDEGTGWSQQREGAVGLLIGSNLLRDDACRRRTEKNRGQRLEMLWLFPME